jgi:hypothetical protein
MTSAMHSMEINCVHMLPVQIWIDGEEHTPSIENAVVQGDALWVMGQQVLLKSTDGIHWQDAAANLRLEGSFLVSSVSNGPEGLRVFARSRNGLRCYGWDIWNLKWEVLFSVPTSAPGIAAAWTKRGLLVAARHDPDTEILRQGVDSDDSPWERAVVSGVAVHLQIQSSGVGLCATWGVGRTTKNPDTIPSAVFFTEDFGSNWREIAALQTMLLTGAPINQESALVGGTGGVLAEVNSGGLENIWQENGGDVVAVDVKGARRIAILESDDEPATHGLLAFEAGLWRRRDVSFIDRVQCLKLFNEGIVVVGTRRALFMCRLS